MLIDLKDNFVYTNSNNLVFFDAKGRASLARARRRTAQKKAKKKVSKARKSGATKSVKAGLSLEERLNSKNLATRKEAEREVAKQESAKEKASKERTALVEERKAIVKKFQTKQPLSPTEQQALGRGLQRERELEETRRAREASRNLQRTQRGFTPTRPQTKEEPVSRLQQVSQQEQEQLRGEVRAAPEPQSFVEKLRRKSLQLEFQSQFRSQSPLETQTKAFASLGTGVLVGATFPIRHPLRTIGTFVDIAKSPDTALKSLVKDLEERPAGTTGELIGGGLFFKGAGRAIKSSPVKVKPVDVKIPTDVGTQRLFRGVSVEAGSRAQPIIGVAEGKVKVATPKLDVSKLQGEFVPETASQARIIRKSLKDVVSPAEARKLPLAIELARKTQRTKTKFTKELPKTTSALNEAQVNKVLEIAKREEARVFGSFPQQAQVKGKFVRTVGDIDIKLPVSAEQIPAKAQQILKELRPVDKTSRLEIRPDFPNVIQARKGGKLLKAVELKPDKGVLPGEELAPERFGGFSLTQKSTKIQGVKVPRLSEQGLRKTASTFTLRKLEGELVFSPKPRRLKDVPDFFAVQESLVESKIFKGKARKKLAELKTLFPKELVDQAVVTPLTEELVSFRPARTTIPPKGSVRVVPTSTSVNKVIGRSPSSNISRVRSPSKQVLSPARSKSISKRVNRVIGSPSVSPSQRSRSPSISPSVSPSRSVSPSKILSPSKTSKSISRSISSSVSPSISKSVLSKSLSKSSRSLSPSLSPRIGRTITSPRRPVPLPKQRGFTKKKKKKKNNLQRIFKFQPSVVAVEGQLRGKRQKRLTGLEVRKIVS